ncbi:uncharacterized protein LOC117114168 [Anneissia japonica]|uniref:uncharacterized protein LOC117114168 n=1 Tax=Anneissia japonica TaxID=1529436 RepID=UPI0014257E80|nr:uncharacterized protein LOC117114168 [Anneissia japonica]
MDNRCLLGAPVVHITQNAVCDILNYRRRRSNLKESMKNLLNSYSSYSLRYGIGDTDFNDPTNQACYVFLYFPALCYGTLHGLLECRRYLTTVLVEKPLTDRCLKVCALGGGPGTDLFGVRMFLNATGYGDVPIKATVLDKYPKWCLAFQCLSLQLHHSSCRPMPISAEYIHLEVNSQSVHSIPIDSIADADLITCSKFVSAVRALPNSREMILAVLRSVKPDAYIFYMDNSKGDNTEYFRSIATYANCTEVTSFVRDGDNQFRLPKTEQSNILQNLSRWFDINSQRNLRVTFMMWKKNQTSFSQHRPTCKYQSTHSRPGSNNFMNVFGSTRQLQNKSNSDLSPQKVNIPFVADNLRAKTHAQPCSNDYNVSATNQLHNPMREAQHKSYVPKTESLTRLTDTITSGSTHPLLTQGTFRPSRLHHRPFTSSLQGTKTNSGISQVQVPTAKTPNQYFSQTRDSVKLNSVQTRSEPHRNIHVTYLTHPPKTQSAILPQALTQPYRSTNYHTSTFSPDVSTQPDTHYADDRRRSTPHHRIAAIPMQALMQPYRSTNNYNASYSPIRDVSILPDTYCADDRPPTRFHGHWKATRPAQMFVCNDPLTQTVANNQQTGSRSRRQHLLGEHYRFVGRRSDLP